MFKKIIVNVSYVIFCLISNLELSKVLESMLFPRGQKDKYAASNWPIEKQTWQRFYRGWHTSNSHVFSAHTQ